MSTSREQAFNLLSQSSPKLREELDLLRAEWAPEDPPITLAFGSLAEVLATIAGDASDDELGRFAEVIETLLTTGTEEVKAGVATGLLEALVAHADQDTIRIIERLGLESKKYLRAWDAFTGVATRGL